MGVIDTMLVCVASFGIGVFVGHAVLPPRFTEKSLALESREGAWQALVSMIYDDCPPNVRRLLDITRSTR